MKSIELLSPAGDLQAMEAALCAGADAVYLGGPKFSARAYAQNFTDEDLAEAIRRGHRCGCKVYLTLNTLLKDEELQEAYAYALRVWNLGVDAIIIQDPALVYLLTTHHPEVELHASTQMTVHNKEGARYLTKKGISRVVLARELSLEEIRAISKEAETEVFIHGALCISYSGKCLMSSLLGGRSGNRGRCAQNCRLPYDLIDEQGQRVASGYLMSPKDLASLNFLKDLVDTGVSSLKIEGRMKRPEYVYETVHQYRSALLGHPSSLEGIRQIFNREGFTSGFLLGNEGADLMAYRSPKNTGIALGRIKDGQIRLEAPLALGDGLRAGEEGFIVTKIKTKGQEVAQALEGQVCELFPHQYREGDFLMKTSDSALLRSIQGKLATSAQGAWPLTLRARFMPGKALTLSAQSGKIQKTLRGPKVEEAKEAPVSALRLEKSLKKSGGTPFRIESLDVTYAEGFLPISAINALRRELLAQMEEALIHPQRQEIALPQKMWQQTSRTAPSSRTARPLDRPYVVTLCRKSHWAAFQELLEEEPRIAQKVLPVLALWYQGPEFLTIQDAKRLDAQGYAYGVRLPQILKKELPSVMKALGARKGLQAVITDNYGVFARMASGALPQCLLLGDTKLNLLNSFGRLLYPILDAAAPSEELNAKELIALATPEFYVPTLYGRSEMMYSEYCAVGATAGGRSHEADCSAPCRQKGYALKDASGEAFPILPDQFCRTTILNGKIKNNLDQQKALQRAGFRHFRADLTLEDSTQVKAVVLALVNQTALPVADATRGHHRRGVE
ncbi:Protease [Clostridiaceae bacterium JG1575]|nr:Protease [Clostridiaceae bacterium JG1575]